MCPVASAIDFESRVDGKISSSQEEAAYNNFLGAVGIDPDDIFDEYGDFRADADIESLQIVYERLDRLRPEELNLRNSMIRDSLLGAVDSMIQEIEFEQLREGLQVDFGRSFPRDPDGCLVALMDLYRYDPAGFIRKFNLNDVYSGGLQGKIMAARLLIQINNPADLLQIVSSSGISLDNIGRTMDLAGRCESEVLQATALVDESRALQRMLYNVSYQNMDSEQIAEYGSMILEYCALYYDGEISLRGPHGLLSEIRSLPGYASMTSCGAPGSVFEAGCGNPDEIGSIYFTFNGSRVADPSEDAVAENPYDVEVTDDVYSFPNDRADEGDSSYEEGYAEYESGVGKGKSLHGLIMGSVDGFSAEQLMDKISEQFRSQLLNTKHVAVKCEPAADDEGYEGFYEGNEEYSYEDDGDY